MARPERHKDLGPVLIIVAVSLLVTIPVFRFGIPFGYDSAEHLSWYRFFVAQLRSGELYPRWLQGMNAGLGSPDLFVYAPLPYYAAAFFRLFTGGPGREVYELGLSIVAGVILAGTAAYYWLKEMVGGRSIPAVAAIVYLLVPYYLKTDLYTRAALAEFWTFAWMPLILYFTLVVMKRRTGAAMAGLALGWGLMFSTHLFTAMLFAPVVLLYAVVVARPGERARSLMTAIAGVLLGAALSGFYLFSALAYEKYVSAYRLIQSRPDYRFDRNFLFSNVAPTNYLKSLSRFTAWTAVVAALFLGAVLIAKPSRLRREAIWWAVVAAGSVLLMLPVGGWLWNHLPLLSAIQFPSRFNTLLTIAAAALAAAALETLRADWDWRQAAVTGFALLLAAAWTVPLLRTMRYQNAPVQKSGPVILDYLITAWTQWTDPKLVTLTGIPMEANAAKVMAAGGTATIRNWEPRSIEFQIDSPSRTPVKVQQFYLPLWTAALADGRPLDVRPSSPEGLITIDVPAGMSDVRLWLPRGISEIAGAVVSGISVVFLILLAAFGPKPS